MNIVNISFFKHTQILALIGLFSFFMLSGCGTTKYSSNSKNQSGGVDKIAIQEGDSVKITFPDAANLNTTAKVRRDGTITLQGIGEIRVAGMTSSELEKALLAKYADQLVSKEISVSIDSSSFQVYITGSVMHPGKIASDRPLTVLEAILEAGGVDYSRANLKGVIITRRLPGHTDHFKVDVQSMLTGKSDESFNLRPNDIIFVGEKFSWF